MEANNISSDNDSSYSVDLLTKILVEYPVINTADIDLQSEILQINFLVKRKISESEWQELKNEVYQKIKVFNRLENNKCFSPKLTKQDHNLLTKVEFCSNLKELTSRKINFSISAIKKAFPNKMLKDTIDYKSPQSDSIEDLLNLIRAEPENKYRGFRDENRVFIFAINS